MFSAAVVGLGQIGQGYDYAIQDSSQILSHASAFTHHAGFQLVAGVDPDPMKRQLFEQKYQCATYPDLSTLYRNYTPDVLALAVPTSMHSVMFSEMAAQSPRAIICEKPIAHDVLCAQEMIALARKMNISLVVNYMRRFEPGVLEMKRRCQQGLLGDIYKIVGYYSKGILNNGSHLIDLLQFIFGSINHIAIIKSGRKWNDFDPEPDVYCKLDNIDVYLLAGLEECYSRFEIEIMGTKGVIKYRSGGKVIQHHSICNDPVFTQYHFLTEEGVCLPNDFLRYQWHVVDHVYQHLTVGIPLLSNGESAYDTLKDVYKMIQGSIHGENFCCIS